MMGTEWVVVQHVPSDYQVSIDSFIGIFTLLLNRYLAVYQLNTFAIYLGNLFFTLQAENAGLLYLYIIGIAKLLYKKQPVFAIEYRQLAVAVIIYHQLTIKRQF